MCIYNKIKEWIIIYLALEGHPSGTIIWYILFAYVLIIIRFLWLTVSATKLVSAMEEFRKNDKSDVDKLKACKKKIIFHSIMTAIPIVLLAFLFLVH